MSNRWMLWLLLPALCIFLVGCAHGSATVENSAEPPMDESVAAATALLEEAAAWREAILTSATQIARDATFVPGETYTETAYYVSNSGNDQNDGRSPDSAWATLDRVNAASLKYGDAVFFERGGVWRDTTVETKEGVTYSAYGEGAKPRICASPENGGDPSL